MGCVGVFSAIQVAVAHSYETGIQDSAGPSASSRLERPRQHRGQRRLLHMLPPQG